MKTPWRKNQLVPQLMALSILIVILTLSFCSFPFMPNPVYHIATGFHVYLCVNIIVCYIQLKSTEKDSISGAYDP